MGRSYKERFKASIAQHKNTHNNSSYTSTGRSRSNQCKTDPSSHQSTRPLKTYNRCTLDVGPKLYVGNLEYSVTSADLRYHFSQYGEIIKCNLVKDEVDKSKGFGFVTFAAVSSATAALSENGKQFWGRQLTVQQAKVQPKKKKINTPRGRVKRSGQVKIGLFGKTGDKRCGGSQNKSAVKGVEQAKFPKDHVNIGGKVMRLMRRGQEYGSGTTAITKSP